MKGRVLILRPEPGASETAARARLVGLDPVVAPLFEVRLVAWRAPDPLRHDAIFFTSANAPRLGGEALRALLGLTVYAVGEATAAAARDAGFETVRTGPRDGAALMDRAAEEGVRSALHLCGRDNVPLRHPAIQIEAATVYAAEAREGPLDIPAGAIVLLHSPRAAALLAERTRDRGAVRLALISAAAAEAAGSGWAETAVAAEPRDEALLEVALRLCQKGAPDVAGAGA